MKKSVLLLAAALTMGAAQAENTLFQTITNLNVSNLPVPVLSAEQQGPNRAKALDAVTPEGTPFDCYMSYYLYGMDAYAYSDRPVQASQAPDGSAIYFGNLFPSFLSNDDPAWTKGEVQADGTILVRVQYIYIIMPIPTTSMPAVMIWPPTQCTTSASRSMPMVRSARPIQTSC